MTITDNMLIRLALGVIATCLLVLALMGPEPATDDLGTSHLCSEDMMCWDPCTMGNLHSGPKGPCPENP